MKPFLNICTLIYKEECTTCDSTQMLFSRETQECDNRTTAKPKVSCCKTGGVADSHSSLYGSAITTKEGKRSGTGTKKKTAGYAVQRCGTMGAV